jgi:hypothetical protein
VAHAFEDQARIPLFRPDGEPLLGMQKFVAADAALKALFKGGKAEWVLAPNNAPEGAVAASGAKHHGDFDDDDATVKATLARILGKTQTAASLSFAASGQRRLDLRRRLDLAGFAAG